MLQLSGVNRRHHAGRDRYQRGGADAALQRSPLPDQRARPVLGQPFPVPLDPEDAAVRADGKRSDYGLMMRDLFDRHGGARYAISVENPLGVCRGILAIKLDGQMLSGKPALIPLLDDGASHRVQIVLG